MDVPFRAPTRFPPRHERPSVIDTDSRGGVMLATSEEPQGGDRCGPKGVAGGPSYASVAGSNVIYQPRGPCPGQDQRDAHMP